jgi:general secretion pathway protein C
MVGHWQAPIDDGAIALTRLPLQYLGGLKAQPLASSVVVLRYGEQVRTSAVASAWHLGSCCRTSTAMA